MFASFYERFVSIVPLCFARCSMLYVVWLLQDIPRAWDRISCASSYASDHELLVSHGLAVYHLGIFSGDMCEQLAEAGGGFSRVT